MLPSSFAMATMSSTTALQPPTLSSTFRFWLPLAATWLMMAAEGPTLTAVIARLADPKLNLAAFGVTWATACEVLGVVAGLAVGILVLDLPGAVAAAGALMIGRVAANAYLILPTRRLLALGRE